MRASLEQSHRNSRIYYNRPGNVMRKDTKGHLFWCQEACSVSCALDSVSHLAAIATNLVAANPRECRPCCPANFFLGSAYGTPSPPPHAPACVLRLTGHGLRCLQRFYDQNSLCTTLFDSEAAFCRLSVGSLDLSTVFWVVFICCPCCLPVPFVEVGVERERIQRCWCSLPTISCR